MMSNCSVPGSVVRHRSRCARISAITSLRDSASTSRVAMTATLAICDGFPLASPACYVFPRCYQQLSHECSLAGLWLSDGYPIPAKPLQNAHPLTDQVQLLGTD